MGVRGLWINVLSRKWHIGEKTGKINGIRNLQVALNGWIWEWE